MKPTIYRPSLALALAAVMGACSNPTEVSTVVSPDVSLSVGEGSAVPPGAPILPLVPQVRVSEGRIDVLGHFRTNTPCWSLASRVERSGSTIVLTVTAMESAVDVCAQVITVRPYEARIAPLAPGVYTMRVMHEWSNGSQKPERVLETQVKVD